MSGRLEPPKALLEALAAAKSVGLVTHVNPDGDGLGCEAALARALRARGTAVGLMNTDPTPVAYAFLGLEAFAAPAGFAPELVLALDCGVLERLGAKGAAAAQAAPLSLVVDHHVPRGAWARHTWAVEDAAATAQMVEALLHVLGWPIDAAMATALYAGLAYDTGCFRHSNTTAEVFECAGRLLRAGADSRQANLELFERQSLAAMRLWAEAVAGMRLLKGGRVAVAAVDQAMLDRCGATWEDCDGLAEHLRSIEGVEVSAAVRPGDPGKAKVSLRSKHVFDVNAFAGRFGGGGHAKAAGATLSMTVAQAAEEIAKGLEEAL